jgi:hypothetical protein
MSALECQFVATASQHIWKDAVIASMGRCGKGEGAQDRQLMARRQPHLYSTTSQPPTLSPPQLRFIKQNQQKMPKKKGVLE